MKKGYIDAEELWLFIDQYVKRLDLQNEQAGHWKSESYKLIVCGRMEAMSAVMDFIGESEIAVERMKALMEDWGAGHDE
jgi:hypothetical protein